jgi:hypothetical protein
MPGGTVDEIPRILRLLQRQTPGDPDWPPPAAWDWRTFAAACETHQLTPYIFWKLQKLPAGVVPPGLLEQLRARFYEISAHNFLLATRLLELTSKFQNEGIPVLAYKGPALAKAVYGDMSLRKSSDLDLLVRPDNLVKAVGLLERLGFQSEPMLSSPQVIPYRCNPANRRHVAVSEEIPFRAPDSTYYVDLHWQLGYSDWRAFSPDVERMWERVEHQQLLHGAVSTFSREDLFLALCYHGTKHRWESLKWLLDVAELLRSGKVDWSRVEQLTVNNRRAGTTVSLTILLARDLLGAPVPSGIPSILPAADRTRALAEAIRDEILMHGKTIGGGNPTLLQIEDEPLARMKYRANWIVHYPGGALREIFVLIDPKDRAFLPLPPKLQFLYHLVRPARLVTKHSMRAAGKLWSMMS